jgi:PAS domain S-box-containing protein
VIHPEHRTRRPFRGAVAVTGVIALAVLVGARVNLRERERAATHQSLVDLASRERAAFRASVVRAAGANGLSATDREALLTVEQAADRGLAQTGPEFEAVRRHRAGLAPPLHELVEAVGRAPTDEARLAAQRAAAPLLVGLDEVVDELTALDAQAALAARRSLLEWLIVFGGLLVLVLAGVYVPTARTTPAGAPPGEAPSQEFDRLVRVAQRIGNAVFFVDAERRVVWGNEGVARLTGFASNDVQGKTVAALLGGDPADATFARLDAALASGVDFSGELSARTRDGRAAWLAVELQPLHGLTDQLTGFMGVANDVTALHQATEGASRVKTEFLATMSHEFRTPLNAVLGFSGLLLETPLNPVQRESVSTIKASGEGLLAVLNDVLDYSNLEAGQTRLDPRSFDLVRCVTDVVASARLRASDLGLTLEIEGLDAVPRVLVADPERVRQVLSQLVGNALKYTLKGGITVAVGVEGGASRRLRLEVRDTGIGIKHEQQASLMRPFSQSDTSTTRRYGGAGLGLALAHRVVDLLGGTMGFQSVEGQGSRFWFTFPLVEGALAEAPPAAVVTPTVVPVVGPPGEKTRVLVAEDNLINQRLVRALLEKLGCEVVLASDGRQAVARHFAGSFELVLMDLHMPGLDGVEATRAIRKVERARSTRRTPIVALTASAVQAEHDACLAAGMDGVLTKPISIEKLAAVLGNRPGALKAAS